MNRPARKPNYFGISLVFEPDSAGIPALSAPDEPGAERGCDCTVSCITLPVLFGLFDAIKAKDRLVTKKTAASTAVVRLRKLADPAEPKRLPDAPLPNAAPMSAPLPC